jgi:hypothetical protein
MAQGREHIPFVHMVLEPAGCHHTIRKRFLVDQAIACGSVEAM